MAIARMELQKKVEELTPHELASKLEDGEKFFIIDVREPFEFTGELGHIEGSINIPMQEIPERLEELREKSATGNLAFVCHSGERSFYACAYLNDVGLKNTFNVIGGMIKWHLSGLDVEYSDQG